MSMWNGRAEGLKVTDFPYAGELAACYRRYGPLPSDVKCNVSTQRRWQTTVMRLSKPWAAEHARCTNRFVIHRPGGRKEVQDPFVGLSANEYVWDREGAQALAASMRFLHSFRPFDFEVKEKVARAHELAMGEDVKLVDFRIVFMGNFPADDIVRTAIVAHGGVECAAPAEVDVYPVLHGDHHLYAGIPPSSVHDRGVGVRAFIFKTSRLRNHGHGPLPGASGALPFTFIGTDWATRLDKARPGDGQRTKETSFAIEKLRPGQLGFSIVYELTYEAAHAVDARYVHVSARGIVLDSKSRSLKDAIDSSRLAPMAVVPWQVVRDSLSSSSDLGTAA